MKLTVVIITKNEERDLPRTLASLKFADEVLVVDSGSTDRTVEIAKKAGTRVIVHSFSSYADQRNYADSLVENGWILSIDADMVVPPELAAEIEEVIATDTRSAYYIGRKNIIWGKAVTVADWSPQDDCHIWLYKKNAGAWESVVHEQYKTRERTGKLVNSFTHYNYENINEYLEKINHYSDLASNSIKGITWFDPLIDFGKRYFYKLGFTAGYHGLFLCYLQMIYFISLKIKLWEKQYTVAK